MSVVAQAESDRLVRAADDPNGMRTVSLRPSIIYGERDNTIIPLTMLLMRRGKTRQQLGDNTNLVSVTYAGNAADAHIIAASRLLLNPEHVAGEAFYINDGVSLPWWTFVRKIWTLAGDETPPAEVKVISARFVYWMAWFYELVAWITRGKPKMTQTMVYHMTAHRSFNCTKARTVLGYEPKVTTDEGLKRSVQVRWHLSFRSKRSACSSTEQSFLANEKK